MANELELRCAAYVVLRRSHPRLPALKPAASGGPDAVRALNACFAEARKLGGEMSGARGLFADVTDVAPALAEQLTATITQVQDSLVRDAGADVLGPLFESTSTSGTRKKRGQHFTPDRVVDLVLSLARVKSAVHVMDPTCGTGAFLTRAASSPAGATLWGCELDPRAAALAAINLAPRPDAAPGHIHEGDLLALLPGTRIQGRPLPACDAVVGNLPYVRLHRQDLARWRAVLGERWATRDATLVTGKRHPKLRLSGHADLYALLFFHLAELVAPGGRMALLTANAYLDAGYGHVLQQLFVRHFRVVAVVESRTEPWFADASVNTVITVLERTDGATTAPAPPTRFVQLTRPLGAHRTPASLATALQDDSPATTTGDLPYTTVKHPDCRVRLVTRAHLETALESQTEPWSAYLRAPDLYFRLRGHGAFRPAGELMHIRRGVTTNWNAFFYPPADAAIEDVYLQPVVRSPRISRTMAVQTDTLHQRLFVCHKSRAELGRLEHVGALEWIEHGRSLRNRQGRPICETLQRNPWYGLDPTPYRLLLTKTTHDTHLHRLLDADAAVDQRLYGVTPMDPGDTPLLAALLNTSVTALMLEVVGVTSLGEGALDLPVTIARQRLAVPDPAALAATARAQILRAFEPLSRRPVLPIWREVEQPDRRRLDRAVVTALELDAETVLPQLYEGLVTLTRERLTLAKKRRALKGRLKG